MISNRFTTKEHFPDTSLTIMSKYYAIKYGKGVTDTIVRSWAECSRLVTGYSGAEFKSFSTEREAYDYLSRGINPLSISEGNPPIREKDTPFIPRSTYQLLFYTDGSFCAGTSGFSVVNATMQEVIYGPVVGHQTSQRAELTGILTAMSWAEDLNKTCEIRTDSKYAVETFNKYVHEWIKRYGKNPQKWHTTTGEPVKNIDLITSIIDSPVISNIVHVRGHNGDYYNELADQYAKKGRNVTETVREKL